MEMVLHPLMILGFKSVELSADVLDNWDKDQLLAAQEAAGVQVVGLTVKAGDF